jgi:hypothetical protein
VLFSATSLALSVLQHRYRQHSHYDRAVRAAAPEVPVNILKKSLHILYENNEPPLQQLTVNAVKGNNSCRHAVLECDVV